MSEIGYLGGFSLGANNIGSPKLVNWKFDYVNKEITIGTNQLTSDYIVKNSQVHYTSLTVRLLNPISQFSDNIIVRVITDTQTISIPNVLYSTVTFNPTHTIKLQYLNPTGSEYVVDMFDSLGRPMILKANYS